GAPGSSSRATFTTSFAAPGTYPVWLKACNGSACAEGKQFITVTNPLGCVPTTAVVRQSVTCHPSVTVPPGGGSGGGGTIMQGAPAPSWAWTADGGSPATGRSETFSTSFAAPGDHVVRLRACDGGDCTELTQTIAVSEGKSPVITSLGCEPTTPDP